MKEKMSEFQQKIHQYSKSTLEMMSISLSSAENLRKTHDIVMSSKTEDEVVQRLKTELETK